jgi:hypothetical protein
MSQPGGTLFAQPEPSAAESERRTEEESEIRALREKTRSDKENRIRSTASGRSLPIPP